MYPTVTVTYFASVPSTDDPALEIYEFDRHVTTDAFVAFCTGGTAPGPWYAPGEEVLAA